MTHADKGWFYVGRIAYFAAQAATLDLHFAPPAPERRQYSKLRRRMSLRLGSGLAFGSEPRNWSAAINRTFNTTVLVLKRSRNKAKLACRPSQYDPLARRRRLSSFVVYIVHEVAALIRIMMRPPPAPQRHNNIAIGPIDLAGPRLLALRRLSGNIGLDIALKPGQPPALRVAETEGPGQNAAFD
jgi:hypothetical protein